MAFPAHRKEENIRSGIGIPPTEEEEKREGWNVGWMGGRVEGWKGEESGIGILSYRRGREEERLEESGVGIPAYYKRQL